MKNNDKFEKTSDFLDLMSRSERKAWERAQKEEKEKIVLEKEKNLEKEETNSTSRQEKYKLKQEENEVKEILKDKKPLKPIENSQIENTQSIKSVEEEKLQVGELGKTQHFLNMTSEIAVALGDNIKENMFEEKTKNSSFNPVIWIGLLIILCFGYFIYLVISSGYNESLLLLIDSGFLLSLTFLFGISIICKRKWMKRFSILNLLLILAFIGINIFLLYDWNSVNENKKEENPVIEVKRKSLTCTSSKIEIKINSKDNIITKIEKTQTFDNEEEQKEITNIFQKQNNIQSETKENRLIVTFDFQKIDSNQYKNIIREYLEYYRESNDFTYVKDDHLYYDIYKETELKGFECTEKEES